MDKQDWNYSAHSLRKLLHAFKEEDGFERKIEYRFALQYNPMFDFFHLWDGVEKKCLSTIRLGEDTVVRFREDTPFKNEILKFRAEEGETKFSLSENLDRHREWLVHQVQQRTERAIEERRAFLDLHDNPRVITFSFPEVQSISRRDLSRTSGFDSRELLFREIRVRFSSVPDSSTVHEIEMMLHKICRSDYVRLDFGSVQIFPEQTIRQAYSIHEQYSERARLETVEREALYRNIAGSTYGSYAASTVRNVWSNYTDGTAAGSVSSTLDANTLRRIMTGE